MDQDATAPRCIVLGCERLSALTDVTRGTFWSYHAHYCSTCYIALTAGQRLEIDPARLTLEHAWVAGPAGDSPLAHERLSAK